MCACTQLYTVKVDNLAMEGFPWHFCMRKGATYREGGMCSLGQMLIAFLICLFLQCMYRMPKGQRQLVHAVCDCVRHTDFLSSQLHSIVFKTIQWELAVSCFKTLNSSQFALSKASGLRGFAVKRALNSTRFAQRRWKILSKSDQSGGSRAS